MPILFIAALVLFLGNFAMHWLIGGLDAAAASALDISLVNLSILVLVVLAIVVRTMEKKQEKESDKKPGDPDAAMKIIIANEKPWEKETRITANYYSIAVGVSLGFVLFFGTTWIIADFIQSFLTGLISWRHWYIVGWGVGLVIGGFFGYLAVKFLIVPGFTTVESVHRAIISILDVRIRSLVFEEGPMWYIPYISEVIEAFIAEETMVIPEVADLSKDQQVVRVSGSLQWKVEDVYYLLQVKDIRASIRAVYTQLVRMAINTKLASELPQEKEWIAKVVLNGDEEELEVVKAVGSKIAEKSARALGLDRWVHKWGSDIVTFNIDQVRLSEELERAMEERRIETEQEAREGKDTDTFTNNVLKSHSKLGPIGVSGEEIARHLNARAGHMTLVGLTGGSDLQKAAATHAILNQPQGRPDNSRDEPNSSDPAVSNQSKEPRRRKNRGGKE